MKVFVYADGGSRGNPGVAGAGSLVVDAETKTPLAKIVYAFSDKASNNVAEYRGLIEGLRAAAQLDAAEAYVFMDSKLVVEQMSGRWKIKHPDMQKLALQARELAQQFERVTYTWVPRAQNKDADELSNVAMDASAAGAGEGIVAESSLLPPAEGSAAAEGAAVGERDDAGERTPDSADPADAAAQSVQPGSWCGASGPATRLILLRHGQTPMSAAQQYAGLRDVELSETGRRQVVRAAEFLARRLRAGDDDGEAVAAVYSSPLMRCRQTADEVARRFDLPVLVDDGLIECDFGAYEGLTFAEADDRDRDGHRAWLGDPAVAPPGGEALTTVHRRVTKAVEGIVDKHRGRTVVLVSHVNPIKSVVAGALGTGPDMFARLFLDLASISVVDYLAGGASVPAQVRAVNDVSYL